MFLLSMVFKAGVGRLVLKVGRKWLYGVEGGKLARGAFAVVWFPGAGSNEASELFIMPDVSRRCDVSNVRFNVEFQVRGIAGSIWRGVSGWKSRSDGWSERGAGEFGVKNDDEIWNWKSEIVLEA